MLGEKLLLKAFGDALPKLNEVLQSIHGFIRLNAMISQEILAQNIARNWDIPILQARRDADEIVRKMEESLESGEDNNSNSDNAAAL